MVVTAASFKAQYTKFANVADTTVDLWIATAEAENDATYFGVHHDRAVALFVAKSLVDEEMAAAGRNGPLSSFSVDKESWSFASSGTGEEASVYHSQYRKLCDDCFLGGISTGTIGRYE